MLDTNNVKGLDDAARQLASLGKKIANQTLRLAMTKVGTRALQKMRPIVPVEQGSGALGKARQGRLRKSLGKKIKKTKAGIVVAVIGPRRGYKKTIGIRRKGPNAGTPIVYDPVKTAHLAGPGRSQTFIEQVRNSMADEAEQIIAETFQQKLDQGIKP